MPETARRFAKRSAIGDLAIGMLGQVAYHLLTADRAHRAPWPVVVLVSCLPVITLGFGVALTHLLRVSGGGKESGDVVPVAEAAGAPARDPQLQADTVSSPVPANSEHAALLALRATLAAGNGYSNNQLMAKFGLTRAQATRVRQAVAAEANGSASGDVVAA